MATVRLTYFDGRGRAEGVRLLLAACLFQFTETLLQERQEYEKLLEDGKLMFHQVPLLEIDGLELVQTPAIVRYVARKGGLYGHSNEEKSKWDYAMTAPAGVEKNDFDSEYRRLSEELHQLRLEDKKAELRREIDRLKVKLTCEQDDHVNREVNQSEGQRRQDSGANGSGQQLGNMATVRLTYFDGRGLAEGVRLLLAACGIEFTETLLQERQEYEKLLEDGKLIFHQVPLLEIDGLELVQTPAIVRYVARKGGLDGHSNEEKSKIDMFYEGTRDFYSYFLKIGFLDPKEVLATAKAKALPRYLPIFDQVLKKNGTGFLVGDSMSLADIGLIEVLLSVTEYFGEETLSDYPSLKAFKSMMVSQERIAAFLKGPQKKRGNTDAYVATCRTVLKLDI
ncbi:glutathione S-transferase A4-like [Haliotis rubra]|uniref:glutathione S-transferase A4-like n=1 Tax=Haliotis rubra TaxID=36100 RepID=UPI001EE5EC68|nr:glutathione S-transferase A4-like [Haliotis rubra]